MNIVTACEKSNYTGLEVLAYSLSKWGRPKLWVLTDGSIKSYESIHEMGLEVVSVIGNDLLPEKVNWPVATSRTQFNWIKLALWLLPDGKYIYVDSDVVCVNPYHELWCYDPISICEDYSRRPKLVPVKSTGDRYNTGVFVFRPSRAIYDELIDLMRKMNEKNALRMGTADQVIISEWLESHEPTILPEKWNMFSKNCDNYKDRWDPEGAVFIHYAGGSKPWSKLIKPHDDPWVHWWRARKEWEAQCRS